MWIGEWGCSQNRLEESDILCDLVDVLGSFATGALMVIWLIRVLGPIF